MRVVRLAVSILIAAGFSAAAAADPYRLGVGDEIRLVIADVPEMTGSFPISSDGTIALPVVSDVPLAGLTLEEAKTALRNRLSKNVVNLSMAVEISRFRPFFILGDVQKPGSYNWLPDLTIEKAVALAGGYRAHSDLFQAAVTGIRASESRHVAERELAQARVLEARLKAELAGQTTFSYDPETADPVLRRYVAEAVAAQQEMFRSRADGLAEQLALLNKEKQIRSDEISALNGRMEGHKRLADQLNGEISSVRDYVSRGLSPTSRLNELIREQSRVQSDTLQSHVLLNQAREGLNRVESQLASLPRDRHLQILSELKETDAGIARLASQLKGDEAIMLEADSAQSALPKLQMSAKLTRNGTVQVISNPLAPVQAGDVVTIERQVERSQAQTKAPQVRADLPRGLE
jgi:polysaccharide biosynthesis/export protein